MIYISCGLNQEFIIEMCIRDSLETGEGLFMPEGAWHCCHNFSDQKARILYFITPKAWSCLLYTSFSMSTV